MIKLMIVAVLAAFAGGAIAEEKVLSVEGKEIAYVGKAVQEKDGVVLTPATVFVGERIVKDDSGVCYKETSVLNAMNKVESRGMEIQLPEVAVRRTQIACPA